MYALNRSKSNHKECMNEEREREREEKKKDVEKNHKAQRQVKQNQPARASSLAWERPSRTFVSCHKCETGNIASGVAGHESNKAFTTQGANATSEETESQ